MTGTSPAPKVKGWNVSDDAPSHRFRTEIPNIVDGMDLDVYSFRLYVHLKRVAGDGGLSYQSTETLATACGMSERQIVRVKKTLIAKNLITVKLEPNPHGGLPIHHIRIVDIWQRNQDTSGLTVTPQGDSQSCKEEPMKKNTLCETSGAPVSHAVKERRATETTVDENIPLDSPKTEKRGGTAHRRMVAVLLDVCHVDNTLGSYAAKIAKQLLDAGYTPDQVEKWYGAEGWWYKVHTKGWSEEFRKAPSLSKIALTVLLAAEANGGASDAIVIPATRNDDGSFNI